jgi:hypothetical protein
MSRIAPHSQQPFNASNSWNLSGIFPYLITLIFSSLYFFNAARLDPEPHHDGYLLATAIAARDGLIPHTQVFNQYGPISSSLLALPLNLGYGPLLTIRISIAVLLVVSCLLVVSIMSKVGHTLAGTIGIVVWVSISPDWTVTYSNYTFVGQWPWPNVVFSFFSLLGLNLFLAGTINIKSQRRRKSRFSLSLFASGFIFSVAVTTRVTAGVVLFIGLIILLALGKIKMCFASKDVATFLLGIFVGLTSFILSLMHLRISYSYLVDTVIGPMNSSSPTSIGSFLWTIFQPVIGAYLAIVIIWIFYKVLVAYSASQAISLALITTAMSAFLFAAHGWLSLPDILPKEFFVPWGKDGLFNAQVNLPLYVALFTIPFVSVFLFMGFARAPKATSNYSFVGHWQAGGNRLREFQVLAIGVLATCLLFGSYPLGDLLHIWWSTPLALAFLVSQFSKVELLKLNFIPFCTASLLPFVMIGTAHLIKQNNVDRNMLNSPALSGMLVSQNYYHDYMSANIFMEKHSSKDIVFMCDDGLFSVWNNYWQSSGPDFVSWSWGPRTPIHSESGIKSVIFCSNNPRETSILARSMGLTITDQAISPIKSSPSNEVVLSSFSRQYLYFAEYEGSLGSEVEFYDHPS